MRTIAQEALMTRANSRKAKPDNPEYAKVKQMMVQATIDVMAEKGYRKFRFEELAERIGYNRATIYRYFNSKEDLFNEVMLALMHQITTDIIDKAADSDEVSQQSFTDSLYQIILDLQNDQRYAIIMDAYNVERFAQLSHEYFSSITTGMLKKYMMDNSKGRTLKKGVAIDDAVHWLIHQIVSYGFFGLKGKNEEQQKAYLKKMVVSVII